MLLIPALLALVAGIARGGNFDNLAAMPYREGWWFGAAFALQLAIYIPDVRTSRSMISLSAPIYILALCLIFVGMTRNWRLGKGLRLAAFGWGLNAMAIVANGGHMPTDIAAMARVAGKERVATIADRGGYSNVRPADARSRLLPLTDTIALPFPPGHGNIYSIGDMLLEGGIIWLVYAGVRTPKVAATGKHGRRDVITDTGQRTPVAT